MEATPVPGLCTYALPVCGKTYSVKSDPELSFSSRTVNFCTQHPFAMGNSES
jgi:hypothetical protein